MLIYVIICIAKYLWLHLLMCRLHKIKVVIFLANFTVIVCYYPNRTKQR